jgi:hypothetical protein
MYVCGDKYGSRIKFGHKYMLARARMVRFCKRYCVSTLSLILISKNKNEIFSGMSLLRRENASIGVISTLLAALPIAEVAERCTNNFVDGFFSEKCLMSSQHNLVVAQ